MTQRYKQTNYVVMYSTETPRERSRLGSVHILTRAQQLPSWYSAYYPRPLSHKIRSDAKLSKIPAGRVVKAFPETSLI